ncbi:MAG: aminoacyl-tRNA hydrolase [Candidatus Omnitrophica bacterium]|nr:aminoacyl-tRNA hydrolase [Candidatus Omnitrophota bacterium]
MWIIAGLGNPGLEYEETRHNYGFLLIERLCRKWEVNLDSTSPFAVYRELRRRQEVVVLIKPLTYMNRSGIAIKQLLAHYNASPENLIVAHDELDLPLGSVKLRKKCGPGGHNGVLSIMEELDTDDFARVRLGVGPRPEEVEGADFVLAPFEDEEVPAVKGVLQHSVDGLETLLARGFDFGMNQINRPPSLPPEG